MQELMDQSFLFFFLGHFVVNLRDDFDGVGGWKVQNSLPYFAYTMDAGDCAFGFGAFASDAKNELWHNVEKVQVGSDFVYLFFDVWSRVVFYRHNR